MALHICRLYDFNIISQNESDDDSSCSIDSKNFIIQMFGKDEAEKSYSIFVENFFPFFYVKVSESWNITIKGMFLDSIKHKVGKYYANSILECKFV